MLRTLIIWILGFILGVSCNKGGPADCFSSQSERVQKVKALDDFRSVWVGQKTDLYLVYKPDTTPIAIIEYFDNLISGFDVEQEEDHVVIRDRNTCITRRNTRNRPKVTLYVPHGFNTLTVESFARVRSVDTLKMRNLVVDHYGLEEVRLTVWEIFGMECNGFNSGGFEVDGFAGYLASTIDDVSYLNARNLILDDLYLFHYSLRNAHVQSRELMEVKLYGRGDVFLHGWPSDSTRDRCCSKDIQEFGQGRVRYY